MKRAPSRSARIIVLGALLALAGCSESHWRTAYAPLGPERPSLEKNAPVLVREAPWERVQDALRELHAESVASDTHVDDWSAERKAAAKARLLTALQVGGDPAAVEIVGKSDFRTTDPLRPDTPAGSDELSRVARDVGADRVVWARRHLGTAETIVNEPVTTFATGTDWAGGSYDRRGRWRGGSYNESWTTWVPVVVSAEEYAYVAYFLRGGR